MLHVVFPLTNHHLKHSNIVMPANRDLDDHESSTGGVGRLGWGTLSWAGSLSSWKLHLQPHHSTLRAGDSPILIFPRIPQVTN